MRHTSAMVPNFVQRVGLAKTGEKQAILKRADHRFIERLEFVSHNGLTSFPRLRALGDYHECAERCKSFSKKIAQKFLQPRIAPTGSRRIMVNPERVYATASVPSGTPPVSRERGTSRMPTHDPKSLCGAHIARGKGESKMGTTTCPSEPLPIRSPSAGTVRTAPQARRGLRVNDPEDWLLSGWESALWIPSHGYAAPDGIQFRIIQFGFILTFRKVYGAKTGDRCGQLHAFNFPERHFTGGNRQRPLAARAVG